MIGTLASAVIFDLFGTLTGAESRRDAHVALLAQLFDVPVELLTTGLRETYDARARGLLGDVRNQLHVLVERAGGVTDPEALDRALAIRMEGQREMMTPRAGTIEVLQDLRERSIAVGVLSDCTAEIPELWPSSPYASLVDFAVFSSVVGFRKPDPIMYETVLSGLRVSRREVMYVGDGGSSELSGATAVGLRAILLRVPGEHHFRYDEEVGWQGETIEDLSSVLDLLSP